MSTYIGEKQIQLLKDGSWEIYSGNMLVEKRDGTEEISGPGFIRQIKQSHFQITIFNLNVKGGEKENILRKLHINYKFKAGEIIPQSESYALITEDGWRCNRLSEPDKYYTENGTITTFYTREIFTEKKRNVPKAKAIVTFIAFHEYKDYPSNKAIRYGNFLEDESEGENRLGWHLCVADVNVWNYSLRFIVHDGESSLRLESRRNKKRHNDSIEFRTIEALDFVLGKPFEWNLKIVSDSKVVRQHILLIPKRLSIRTRKPYSDDWVPKSKAFTMFWDLYSKFLHYILKEKTSCFSELGSILKNLAYLRSSDQELSAYILNLCVAIEDLLLHHFCKKISDYRRSNLISDLLEKVNLFLEERQVEKELKNIIKSHIARLNPSKESSKRALLRLASENKILDRRIKSWEDIRHKAVHGQNIIPTQDTFNKIGDLETLLFQVIFQMIGYKGKYNDYGIIGYPKKTYPKEL